MTDAEPDADLWLDPPPPRAPRRPAPRIWRLAPDGRGLEFETRQVSVRMDISTQLVMQSYAAVGWTRADMLADLDREIVRLGGYLVPDSTHWTEEHAVRPDTISIRVDAWAEVPVGT
jgi:hypothetical protein